MIEIIPAIDIIGGQCVRLTQGDYDRRETYYDDPLDAAKMYEQAGVRRLHMVDLDGAKESFPANLAVLERVSAHTNLDIQWGGGIKSEKALEAVFAAGARRAICGSVAVSHPEQVRGWLARFGGGKIILGADVKNGMVATHGWLATSGITAAQLIASFLDEGLQQVICTEISRDGMLQGPAFGLYNELYTQFPTLDITASGGISGLDDILRLDKAGVRSVIVGKAIYENKISMEQLKACLQNA